MKKIMSICGIVALGVASTGAFAAPSYIQRDARGGYSVTYDYTDKAKSGWYIGGHAGLSLLNFDTDFTMSLSDREPEFTDKFSMEPVFSGSVVAGFEFNYFWRAELELGYIGQLNDADNAADLKMFAPYALANVYYDFTNGVYVGAGAGLSFLTTIWDGVIFDGGDRREMSVSPMLGVMLGYSYELDYNLVLDVRYRLAGMMGHDHNRTYVDGNEHGDFKTDTGLILDNSLSIGVRYEF